MDHCNVTMGMGNARAIALLQQSAEAHAEFSQHVSMCANNLAK
jgi:hypothetical protein